MVKWQGSGDAGRKERNPLKALKPVAALLVLLILFTVPDAAFWYTSPDSFHSEQGGTVSVLMPDGNRLDTSALPAVRTVAVRFAAPLEEEASASLACSRDGVSELSTKETACPAGAREVSFSIPKAAYQYIELHLSLPADIASASVSDGAFVRVQSPYPFRPLRTLLPAALLLLLGLLFLRVPPLRRLLQLTDRNVLAPETRRKGITAVYAAFALLMLMQHVYVTLCQKVVTTAAETLWIPLILLAALGLLLGKLWKDPVFWIFLALLCLKLLGAATQDYADLWVEKDVFILSAYAFFGAYAAARVLPRDAWKRFLSAFCLLWTLSAAVYAAFSLYTAFTGHPVPNLGTESIHILDNRLYPIYHPVVGGSAMSLSVAVALIGFCLTQNRALKVLYTAAAAALFLACSPTGARTAYVLTGMELALLLGLLVYDRLKPGRPDGFFRSIGKYAILVLVLVIITGAVALAQSYAFEAIRLPGAGAERAVPTDELAHRGFDLSVSADAALAGRLTVWKNVLQVILESPKNLLLGQSVLDPMRMVNTLRTEQGLYAVNHCHNTPLQILLENGLPGFLLYLAFCCILLFRALRVLRNRSLPFWQRLLPIPALACLIGDLTDCASHVTFGYPQMTLLFLFAGFTIALARAPKKAEKKGGLPKAPRPL